MNVPKPGQCASICPIGFVLFCFRDNFRSGTCCIQPTYLSITLKQELQSSNRHCFLFSLSSFFVDLAKEELAKLVSSDLPPGKGILIPADNFIGHSGKVPQYVN